MCGTSMAACNEQIREHGTACCEACLPRDTHSLLAAYDARDVVAELRQEVERLRADVAAVRERQETIDEEAKRALLVEVVSEVRAVVLNLPERIGTLERCLTDVETHLKLRRKPALPPPVAT